MIKKYLFKLPLVGKILSWIKKQIIHNHRFLNSGQYWIDRYEKEGNSGAGSYHILAEFKARIINDFVVKNNINSVIEYGSGDGNQLKYFRFNKYIGFDISAKAIDHCRNLFREDPSKTFILSENYSGEKADLTISLDVIYHLVEDEVFDQYMNRLFSSSNQFVIIYSSNTNINLPGTPPHIKNRCFTEWVGLNAGSYGLIDVIKNDHPYKGDATTGSISDFYLYKRKD